MKQFFDLNVAVKVEDKKAYIFKHKETNLFLKFNELKNCKVTEVETYIIAAKKEPFHVKFEEVAYEALNSGAFCKIKKELDAA